MELRLPPEADLRTAYERDLTPSFPPSERKPLSTILASVRAGRYEPWCLYDGETIMGECFLWLGNPGFALLDYLCVTPGYRNQGLGTLMLERLRARLPDTVILCESEAPVHAEDPALAERRLHFYTRNGAFFAGFDAEVFGVHYRMLYWSPHAVPDRTLLAEYEDLYRSGLPKKVYQRFLRIPRDPAAERSMPYPWQRGREA